MTREGQHGPALGQIIDGLDRYEGFVPVFWNRETARVYFAFPAATEPFLYTLRLSQGLGEFPLERGQLSRPVIVTLRRQGSRLLLIAANYAWRTSSPDPFEQRSVRTSFPESVLWSFPITAQDEAQILVDGTDFLMHDHIGIATQLERLGHGAYRPDVSRSFVRWEECRAFPRNSQLTAAVTFVNDKVAPLPLWNSYGRTEGMAALAPDPRAVTLGIQHGFVKLPEPGYDPRPFDPRSSYFSSVIFHDFGRSTREPIDVHLMLRHRLNKVDPYAAVSEVGQPIVYYVDNGAPREIRQAIIEGASWWAGAFEAAGFRNAFRVEQLPADADPMDIRYNTITWAAKARRGFAYGGMLWDPRTGEIIKGEVTLTALRDRHLRSMAEAFTAPFSADNPREDAVDAFVLARIRHLAAHETGHSLGLEHNHAAIPGGSVMDYPVPRFTLDQNGRVDISAAYSTGLSAWDHVSIDYGYHEFPPDLPAEQREAVLAGKLDAAHGQGLYYMGIKDAQPADAAHPHTNFWTGGEDAPAELARIMAVRAAALDGFNEGVLRPARPMALLEELFLHVYFHHHLQVATVARALGGSDYRYALRGDGQQVVEPVGAADQRAALAGLLDTLVIGRVAIPEHILKLLAPRPPEYPRHRDTLIGHTGPMFDALGAVERCVMPTLTALCEPHRANRLVEQHGRDAELPGLSEVLRALLDASWGAVGEHGPITVRATIERCVLEQMLGLARHAEASPLAAAITRSVILDLRSLLAGRAEASSDVVEQAHLAAARALVDRLAAEPPSLRVGSALTVPQMSPL